MLNPDASTRTKVVLADDHTLVLAGLRALLEKIPGIEVIAEASDGREALTLIKERGPNVVLMDIAMPSLNGLQACARVKNEYPAVKVIMLSMHANEEYVLQALRSGAVGYLLKDADVAELELALKAVMTGEVFLSPRISRQMIDSYLARMETHTTSLERLTARQREIVQLIAEGKNTKEIAFMLGVSVKTVEAHRAQVMKKLQIRDIAGLVRYALGTGLVTFEPPPQPGP